MIVRWFLCCQFFRFQLRRKQLRLVKLLHNEVIFLINMNVQVHSTVETIACWFKKYVCTKSVHLCIWNAEYSYTHITYVTFCSPIIISQHSICTTYIIMFWYLFYLCKLDYTFSRFFFQYLPSNISFTFKFKKNEDTRTLQYVVIFFYLSSLKFYIHLQTFSLKYLHIK